jgi:hypothetical protein
MVLLSTHDASAAAVIIMESCRAFFVCTGLGTEALSIIEALISSKQMAAEGECHLVGQQAAAQQDGICSWNERALAGLLTFFFPSGKFPAV